MKTHLTIMMIIAALGMSACEKKENATLTSVRERKKFVQKSSDPEPVTKSAEPEKKKFLNATETQLQACRAMRDFMSARLEAFEFRGELLKKMREARASNHRFDEQVALIQKNLEATDRAWENLLNQRIQLAQGAELIGESPASRFMRAAIRHDDCLILFDAYRVQFDRMQNDQGAQELIAKMKKVTDDQATARAEMDTCLDQL